MLHLYEMSTKVKSMETEGISGSLGLGSQWGLILNGICGLSVMTDISEN